MTAFYSSRFLIGVAVLTKQRSKVAFRFSLVVGWQKVKDFPARYQDSNLHLSIPCAIRQQSESSLSGAAVNGGDGGETLMNGRVDRQC